jgi:hypothetical protein
VESGDQNHAFVVPSLDDHAESDKSKKAVPHFSQKSSDFKAAFEAAIKEQGVYSTHDDHGNVRAVSIDAVRDRFMALYKPKGDHPDEAKRKAWKRALNNCTDCLIYRDDWEGQEWLYIEIMGAV